MFLFSFFVHKAWLVSELAGLQDCLKTEAEDKRGLLISESRSLMFTRADYDFNNYTTAHVK